MADPELKAQVERLIAENPILLFMKGTPDSPSCGFSLRTVGVLEQLGIEYGAVDVLPALQPLREVTTELSDWQTFPQLYVNGELVGVEQPAEAKAPEPERILPGGSQVSPPMQLG